MGDPSVDESVELARACVDAGADMLELGVPFSDPTADGPAIARASQRAIAAGRRPRGDACGAAQAARRGAATRGSSSSATTTRSSCGARRGSSSEAADAGVDALLVVDLPIEEGAPLRAAAQARGLSARAAPRADEHRGADRRGEARRRDLADGASSTTCRSTGVTGAAGAATPARPERRAARLRRELGLPVVVGFGIDSAEKARAAAEQADGVVVGTALVRAIEDGKTYEERGAA